MPLASVRRWRIHLGAHKTATTHLQETLAVLRPALVEREVDYIPLPELRRSGLAAELGRRRPWIRLPPLRGLLMRRIVARCIEPLRAGPTTLLVSEERLIGGSPHVFAEPIYPAMERNVTLLATLRARAEVRLFLAIRSFDTQLPSAYVQSLRYRPPIGNGFESIKTRVLRQPPSWFELVRRIRSAAPEVPLRVWRYEDYRSNAPAVLAVLTGVDGLALPEVPVPAWTRSPGLAAIRAVEALPAMPQPAWRERVRAIFRADPGDGPPFEPFSEEERAVLQAGYAADVERIAAFDPTILLRF
jgi:hypothetical protein